MAYKLDKAFLLLAYMFLGAASARSDDEGFSKTDIIQNESQRRLRVVIKPIEPFVYAPVPNKEPAGFSIDLWKKIELGLERESEFTWASSVPEMLGCIEHNEADIAIGALTITAQRETSVDFTHSFYRSGLRIAGLSEGSVSLWSMSKRFLALDLVGLAFSLILMTFVTSNLLWFCERHVNASEFPRAYFRGIGEATWWSVCTVITGGCENKAPISIAGRIIALVWMLGGIVLVATFTATLASRMTTATIRGAVNGPQDLPGRRVATIANTAVAEDMKDRLAQVVPCSDLDEAFQAVLDRKADVVVFDAPVLAHFIEERRENRLSLVGPLFDHQDYGIAIPSNSPLREQINRILLELTESGELAELNQKWFGQIE